MDNTRRRFLSQSLLSAAALALPLGACAQDRPPPVTMPAGPSTPVPPPAGPLLARAIPATGETIPVIGVGTSGSYEVAIGSAEFDGHVETMLARSDCHHPRAAPVPSQRPQVVLQRTPRHGSLHRPCRSEPEFPR